ncbi:zinc-ribbon domain-containing protein [Sorangium cellulosum]|uniref:zinc-ribbon domain-containing protein n=1 Tax=Sorangium cellulosum TaxID=56 RepID=UPI001331C00F|nr:zinc-ribbon domain-containing protein [Sorangium cellulosum]
MGQPFARTRGPVEQMDVTCERCSTEYEFDDALVSERGTTVKCTNCGFQFKVRRADGALPERWVVRTLTGRELEFRMLRELQAAIAQGKITRDDVISRGNSRPRRLGSIAELEPFFKGPGGVVISGTALGIGGPAPLGARSRSLTPQGLGGPAPAQTDVSVAIPLPRAEPSPEGGPESVHEAETVVRDVREIPSSRERPPQRRATLPVGVEPESGAPGRAALRPGGPPGVVVPPEDAPPLPDGHLGRRPEPRTLRGAGVAEVRHASTRPAAGDAGGGAPLRIPNSVPPPHVEAAEAPGPEGHEGDAGARARRGAAPQRAPGGERAPRRSGATAAVEPEGRPFYVDDADGDTRITSLPTRRTGVARWVVGLIVVGLLVVSAATLGPKYFKSTQAARPQTSDDRVPVLLGEGERSLTEGDLETARDKLVKASALAEDDPRVAAALVRLETVNAEMRWLRLQLLTADDPDVDTMRHERDAAIERARKAVEHARRVAPEDAGVSRAAIDLLRMQGDLAAARRLVGAISAESAQPENALTLAALDLAEAQPSWAAVIERLRTAASSEKGPGRARMLLVYALARSGDLAAARVENERLLAMGRPHPLARSLRAFLDRLEKEKAQSKPDRGAEPASSARPESPAPAAPDPVPPAAPVRPRRGPDPGDGRVPDDYVAPGGTIDTSDLPGVHPPPAAQPSPTPPEIDTSDLPGIKHE